MKYFSTFTGIGGFEVGIDQVDPNAQHVGYSEIDKYASSVYERHFPHVRNYGDITKINADELPDFDCLVGGFPCQAFSIAGKRRGFEDTRGTLFFDLARILKAKTPRLFVFENVKGLLSHDSGATFKTIIAAIDELGYDCQWQVLNSKNHGVPQNRERIIIVGHLRGTPRPEVFPFVGNSQETANEVTAKGQIVDLTRREPTGYRERADNRAGTLAANYYKGIANQERPGVIVVGNLYDNGHNSQPGRVYAADGISPTIGVMQGGQTQPKVLVPEATKKGYAEATVGQAINLSVPNSKTRRGRVSDIAPTLDTGMQLHTLTEDVRIRRLTPIECERLQAFPDNHTEYGIEWFTDDHGLLQKRLKSISDTQRYKMCGNAVTTNVIRDVFIRILNGPSE